ncbi:MAG: hypothetical protein U9N60_05960, partial [Thermodesulfobacteriota bacterium]|nr:hypothetical protein [Thermodesulfobacteriota bacterium]
ILILDQMQGNAGYDDASSSRHKYNLSLFHLIGYQKNVVCPLFRYSKNGYFVAIEGGRVTCLNC